MRRYFRFPIAVALPLAIVIALIVVYAAKEAWIPWIYSVSPPQPHYPKPRSEAEAQRDDLDYLRNITWLDWSYTDATRARANQIIDAAEHGRLPLSQAAFELVVTHVLATADNGHTNVWGSTTANRFNRLPLRFYVFRDGIFVVRALPIAKPLLGRRLDGIDGTPIETIRARLRMFTGGTENEKNSRLPFYLESPALLNAAGIAKKPDRLTLDLTDGLGHSASLTVAALAADPSAKKLWPSTALEPVLNAGENRAWIPALRGIANGMLMFGDAPKPFFARPLPAEGAWYVRFATNSDEDGMSISDFANRTLAALTSGKPRTLIIDLRMNGGGDYTTTASFMRMLPDKLGSSTIYVLISQETFSAGMTSAAFLKQAGGARVIFVGDWPGDRIRFHSEGSDVCLPYSHICVTARTAIHDYSTTDCRPYFECFLLDRFYPVAIRTFAPGIYAPLTWAALSTGHDPALDAIFHH